MFRENLLTRFFGVLDRGDSRWLENRFSRWQQVFSRQWERERALYSRGTYTVICTIIQLRVEKNLLRYHTVMRSRGAATATHHSYFFLVADTRSCVTAGSVFQQKCLPTFSFFFLTVLLQFSSQIRALGACRSILIENFRADESLAFFFFRCSRYLLINQGQAIESRE